MRMPFITLICMIYALLPSAAFASSNSTTYSNLETWASKAVSESLTFGSNNYDQRLISSKQYFDDKGYADFKNDIEKSRFVEMIIANQQKLTAGAVVPKDQEFSIGIIDEKQGKQSSEWTVKVPITLLYTAPSQSRSEKFYVTVKVIETPSGDLKINSWTRNPNDPTQIADLKSCRDLSYSQIIELRKRIIYLEDKIDSKK